MKQMWAGLVTESGGEGGEGNQCCANNFICFLCKSHTDKLVATLRHTHTHTVIDSPSLVPVFQGVTSAEIADSSE